MLPRMADLLGRFELVEKIATGGMGDVYLAHQWGDGGFVRASVVKRLHPHLSERPTALDDFRNEAALLATCHQRHHAMHLRLQAFGEL